MNQVINFQNELLNILSSNDDHPENHMSIFQIFVFKYLLFSRYN